MREDFEELPSEALKDYYTGNYEAAHEKYEWYFENAEQLKPSLRGVRVSFCLAGWVDVAKKYPPAMNRISELKTQAIDEFNKKSSIEAFRDFSCISRYLETGSEVLDIFYKFHRTDKDIAKKLFRHAYEFLVEKEEWEICSEYMDDFSEKYRIAFKVFDKTPALEKDIDEEFSELLLQDRIKLLRKSIVPLFEILKIKQDASLHNQYLEQVKVDFEKRGLSDLYSEL